MRSGRYFFQSTASKKLAFSTGTTCGAAPSAMSTQAFWPAEYSVASVLMMRAMSAPGRKLTRMLVPKALFIAAWKRAAPWMPAKVELLQDSVTRAFLVGGGGELLERGVDLLRRARDAGPTSAKPATEARCATRNYDCGTGIHPRWSCCVSAAGILVANALRCEIGHKRAAAYRRALPSGPIVTP